MGFGKSRYVQDFYIYILHVQILIFCIHFLFVTDSIAVNRSLSNPNQTRPGKNHYLGIGRFYSKYIDVNFLNSLS